MAGKTVGHFETKFLVEVLGRDVEIRKSGREDAKFPLYLSTKVGPVPINTRKGQDILLELGTFQGAPEVTPEIKPEVIPDIQPEVAPEIKPADVVVKPRWLDHDPDLGI